MSYEVPCRCGQVLRGQRQEARQIVACPRCGRKCFILPKSPWKGRGATTEAPAHFPLGRLLAGIVVGGALAMGLIFLLARPYLRRVPALDARTGPHADLRARLEAGERELRDGNVHLALQEFQAALVQRNRDPEGLTRAEHRRLEQLYRQCDLLAHLLDRSLEEIVQQALQHRRDDEWRAKFADYRGRAVVFDDVLRQDAQGRPSLAFYVVRAGDIEARVALEDLTLLRQLPLDPPQRWLFGARLADCRREQGGVWVVRFEPESAVLLTEEPAAAACCPQPLDDELQNVLKRQEEWISR
jgi:hypothetical protein